MATEKNSEELYFEWWLEELKSLGLVLEYQREPHTFEIAPAIPIFYNQIRPKTPIVKSFNLFGTLVYTPDYRVKFSKKLINKMIGVISKEENIMVEFGFAENGSVYQNTIFYTTDLPETEWVTVYFDVKPPASAQRRTGTLGSSRDFKYISRMMYENHGIIVNKATPIGTSTSLFCKTFLPKRYQFTDVSGKPRKLKDYEMKAKSLSQYLSLKNINL